MLYNVNSEASKNFEPDQNSSENHWSRLTLRNSEEK